MRRGRLRQRVSQQAPRAIPDRRWDELFAVMRCNRDRALLEIYVSSGARATELLDALAEDVDWAEQLIYVISKGTRLRQGCPCPRRAFAIWPPTSERVSLSRRVTRSGELAAVSPGS